MTSETPILRLRDATLSFGDRELRRELTLEVRPGEFLAVLGPNGTGTTSLLKTILGQQKLTSGSIDFLGEPVGRGSARIGYIPQQKLMEYGTPLRARDVVTFGLNGDRWGLPLTSRAVRRQVDDILASVGASEYANVPVATLSGGEQQRVRVGQSIAGSPSLLLCDEPLISIDLHHQRQIGELIDERRKALGTAVVFVTHDVNPILGMVDRVLYLAGGRFRIGTPDEVLCSEVLSALYDTPVDVIRSRGSARSRRPPHRRGAPVNQDFWHQIFGFDNYGELLALVKNSIIAVLMPFGLGLGILFLALYKGRSANKFGLLTGQIVSVDNPQLLMLVTISVVVIAGLIVVWRPLSFASVDADVARAKGLPVTAISIVFMILLGLATAVSIQIVGALLVLSLLVTPATAAMRVTASPFLTPLLSVVFAVVSVVGGIMLALGGGLPISPFVTTISFLIYVVSRAIGARRDRAGNAGRRLA